MKVALVIERLGSWRGGAETSTAEFASLLVERGADLTIVTAEPSDAPASIRTLVVAVPRATPRPMRTMAFARAAAEAVRGAGFDIVHAITPMPQATIYQPRGGLMRETQARNVALRRSAVGRAFKRFTQAASVKQRLALALEAETLRAGGPIVACVSQYVAEQCRTHYGIGPERARVVFNGVNIAPPECSLRAELRRKTRASAGIGDDDVLCVCVAHNFRLKGVGPLIEATALARQRGGQTLRVWVVGRDASGSMQRLAARRGVADVVRFVGAVPDVVPIWCAADVCVHPTYYDPCSRVVLEALTMGVPCVTTRFNGAAEVMREGEHGFVFATPDDVEALSSEMLRLGNASERARMGAAAVELGPRLSMARHVDEMLRLYEELAPGRGASSGA